VNFKSRSCSLISDQETETIIDLGRHGFADSFFEESDYVNAEQSVPLICQLDRSTGLVQTLNLTTPKDRYEGVPYSYTSANSETSRKHWMSFASYLSSMRDLNDLNVLEIGSNDGFLLNLLKERECQVLGVDASQFMADLAIGKGIDTLCGIFGESEELISEINSKFNSFQIIVANNVLNHSNNPLSFAKAVKKLLSDDGLFIFEVPYWLETIKSLRFDQIYHEHVSYFTVKAAKELLRLSGLEIIDIKVVDYHGGSLRITATHESEGSHVSVETMISAETNEGLFSVERYERYFKDISDQRDLFMSNLQSLKKSNKDVFGIGAGAKANTLLTFYNLNNDILKFIVDASKFKQGKITPVTKIPIFSDVKVRELSDSLGIVLVWNINQEVRHNILQYNPRVKFINI
jgi:SAM-dependent methyltransferase